MSHEDPGPTDDELLSLAASCDDALADGRLPDPRHADEAPEEFRSDLARRLDCMRMLRHVWPGDSKITKSKASPGGSSSTVNADLSASAQLPTHIGRFELGRELGRGGFGVVFLAYDPQLRREVALKVPRTQAFLDPQLRARFHREAQTAANLDHPSIVQVFEAGEAGPVCYIASAYCPGPTLAVWLREQAAPIPFRDAASLIAVLANAVAYAHSRGIVHRDLKPANILLQRSEDRGQKTEVRSQKSVKSQASAPLSGLCLPTSDLTPKITDFGLAKWLDEKSDGTHGYTQSGAVVGTAHYMAPEQACSKAGTVGIATDVYSLGVILYELLTGRPPFQGDSTQEVLRQVESAEPLSPRRLRPKAPRDLETICLKCLEKDARRRYASAEDLAADLTRYLAGEPVRARPSGRIDRAVKWARRRPTVAALLAAVGLSLTLGVAGICWQWWRAERNAATASLERDRFHAEWNRAEKNLQWARAAVDELGGIGGNLLDQPFLRPTGIQLLEKYRDFYEHFLQEKSGDPDLRHQAGKAQYQLADIYGLLGQTEKAENAFKQGSDLLANLVAEFPDNRAYRRSRAGLTRQYGHYLRDREQYARAEAAYNQAIIWWNELLTEEPGDSGLQSNLANTVLNKCPLLALAKRFDEAESAYRQAIGLQEQLTAAHPTVGSYWAELALCRDDYGMLQLSLGRSKVAEDSCRQGLEIRQKLMKENARDFPLHRYLARSHRNLGAIYAATGRLDEARTSYRQANALLESVLGGFPDVVSYREDLIDGLKSLLQLVRLPAFEKEREQIYRERQLHTKKLSEIVPHGGKFKRMLADEHREMAGWLYRVRRFGESIAESRLALEVQPNDAECKNALAWALVSVPDKALRDPREALTLALEATAAEPKKAEMRHTLGVVRARLGDYAVARDDLEAAIRLRSDATALDCFCLALVYGKLGNKVTGQQRFAEGLELMKKLNPVPRELERYRVEAAAALEDAGSP
jgi:serine/threonine protein kinase/tetratricopeptide (TPR) repeat protein